MGLNKRFVFVIVIFCFQMSYVFSQEFIETKRLDSISMFFKFGSAEVSNPQILITRCNRIKATSGKIRIVSYTDTVGNKKSNQKLAAQRFNSIYKIIKSTNLGSFSIDSINKNEQRERNKGIVDSNYRRVDIIIFSVENKFKFNTPINLNINFESNTDNIIPSSTENLKTLLSILCKDSTLSVQLNGHVCCRPNQQLSMKRAESVKKFLISNGINASRIQCKGFSNTVPIYSAHDMNNYQKNMRVEVIFIKK